MSVVTAAALTILGLSGGLCLIRLLLGKSIGDRIVALDSILIMIASGIAIYSLRIKSNVFLDLLFVAALVGFVGTVAVARFIERRGS